jgi:transcriptional regulator with PAS, ATPase and Fis domain
LQLPPFRERKEDIPGQRIFPDKYAAQLERPRLSLKQSERCACFMEHNWPANIYAVAPLLALAIVPAINPTETKKMKASLMPQSPPADPTLGQRART